MACAGDTVLLKVDVSGAADGTPVTFKVADIFISPPGRVASVRGKVEGGLGTAEWQLKVPRAGTRLEFEGQVRRVGSGSAEIPVKNEVAVRVGVFFDGTGNNMHNDLPKGIDTNIVRLYELYNTNAGQEDKKPAGEQDGLALYTDKIYRNGVGTADGQEDSTYGLATGSEGVSRIESALAGLREFLGKFAGQEGPRTVDVFGFSRGAALARDFVNQVNKELGEDGVRVGFVGIFDTVASFGPGGNNLNTRWRRSALATGL